VNGIEDVARQLDQETRREVARAARSLIDQKSGRWNAAAFAEGVDMAGRVIARTGYKDDPGMLRAVADAIEQSASTPLERGYARGLRIIAAGIDAEP
jgi:hypothetical protein